MGNSQIGARLAFENSKKLAQNAGLSLGKAVLSQSFLRFEVGLVQGQTSYTFDVLTNDNTQPINYNTQQKLNLQDSFVCSELGFFLAVPSSNTDTEFSLLTYPNTTQLTAANASKYKTIYQGQMSLNVNQKTIITNWDLSRHYIVPQTQQNMVTGGYAAAALAPAILPQYDSVNLNNDGFVPVEPNFVLVGSKKNDLKVTLPAGLSAVTANSRLVCIMRGIMLQNSTSVN
jgi:hypothetical protein